MLMGLPLDPLNLIRPLPATVRRARICTHRPLEADQEQCRLRVQKQTSKQRTLDVRFSSLIGHLGSSAFRLSTTTVSMSLAGSCFSSESAPGPFHHGIRRRGGTIF